MPLMPGSWMSHQDERGMSLARDTQALFARLGLDRLVALDLQRVPDQLQVLGIVLDDEDQLIRHGAPGA
jgi:hypothetical protein